MKQPSGGGGGAPHPSQPRAGDESRGKRNGGEALQPGAARPADRRERERKALEQGWASLARSGRIFSRETEAPAAAQQRGRRRSAPLDSAASPTPTRRCQGRQLLPSRGTRGGEKRAGALQAELGSRPTLAASASARTADAGGNGTSTSTSGGGAICSAPRRRTRTCS